MHYLQTNSFIKLKLTIHKMRCIIAFDIGYLKIHSLNIYRIKQFKIIFQQFKFNHLTLKKSNYNDCKHPIVLLNVANYLCSIYRNMV